MPAPASSSRNPDSEVYFPKDASIIALGDVDRVIDLFKQLGGFIFSR